MVLNGLPPGDFPVSIFDVVLNGITIRGSIVGTRLDLKESIEFATAGKVKAIVKAEPLENINDIFTRMREGTIEGRIVVDYHLGEKVDPPFIPRVNAMTQHATR
jgi:propanol-preferring alcohol dehydrogenase